MKVLMVAPSVRVPDTLGQTLHQLALANGLAKRGLKITLLCRYNSISTTTDFDSNLKFLSVSDPQIPFERLIFTYNSYKLAIKELKANDYDLVHDRGYIFAGSGVKAAKECGVKSILQVDDNWIRSERSATKFAKYWLYNKKAVESCYNQIDNADGGFTVSSVLREQITKWNFKAQDFQVIQNGYESDLFVPTKKPLGIKNKLGIEGKLAVFVGALGPWHGIDEIVSVAKANPSLSVVVAGGGYGKNLPDLDNLYHIGRLNRDEVPRLLVEADIGLAPYPNLDYGFSPLKVYEYMGCKLPVFATDLPSVREATEGNAFLAKPGSLSSLVSDKIDDEEELNRIANLAYDYATKRRTWDNTIDETIELYNRIIL